MEKFPNFDQAPEAEAEEKEGSHLDLETWQSKAVYALVVAGVLGFAVMAGKDMKEFREIPPASVESILENSADLMDRPVKAAGHITYMGQREKKDKVLVMTGVGKIKTWTNMTTTKKTDLYQVQDLENPEAVMDAEAEPGKLYHTTGKIEGEEYQIVGALKRVEEPGKPPRYVLHITNTQKLNP